MAETIGGDIGTQILNAVQGLGIRMDRFEARMDKLEARMDGLEAQVTDLKTQVTDLKTQVTDLKTQVTDLKTQVTSLDSRMKRQERLMESLGAEFLKWREGLSGEILQLRGDMQLLLTDLHEGFRRLNARIDLTDGAVVLMASVLRRPTDLGENLEKRLQELQTH